MRWMIYEAFFQTRIAKKMFLMVNVLTPEAVFPQVTLHGCTERGIVNRCSQSPLLGGPSASRYRP